MGWQFCDLLKIEGGLLLGFCFLFIIFGWRLVEWKIVITGQEKKTLMAMAMAMASMSIGTEKLSFVRFQPSSSCRRLLSNSIRCTPLQEQVDRGILCEPCNGRGWLLCDFCEGQKTNVKSANNRIFRRCPSCRAVGYILCSNCKVFKCVTFPNYTDGEELTYGA